MMSRTISTVPKTARPTRRVKPMMAPFRLRMAEMRCSVRAMPARLSSPKSPMRSTTWAMSAALISNPWKTMLRSCVRTSASRPRSITISIRPSLPACSAMAARRAGGSTSSSIATSAAGSEAGGASALGSVNDSFKDFTLLMGPARQAGRRKDRPGRQGAG